MLTTRAARWCSLLLVILLKDVRSAVPACGGQLTQAAGQILSPNFPSQYPDNNDCSWVITVQEGSVIDLTFLSLDLEDSTNQQCTDYVAVHNGPSRQDAIVSGDLCLSSSERHYRSRGNTMLVHFHSDGTFSRTGFSASYKTVDCEPLMYGRDECDKNCTCQWENTLYCNSVNGSCVCKNGWTAANCSVDIDECSLYSYLCPALYSKCVNTPGSHECACMYGMQFNATGQCSDPHACKTKNCSHACGVENSVETCYCPQGMQLDPQDDSACQACEDWKYGENCAFNCDCNKQNTMSCDKIDGLCSCYLNWTSTYCGQDVDECGLEKQPCETEHSVCYNTYGSFECRCLRYYEQVDDELSCQECGRTLTNTSGSIVSHVYDSSGYTRSYWDHEFDCNWTISVDDSHVISLQFPYANNSGLTECKVDIFDGDSIDDELIGSYNTRDSIFYQNPIIRSSSNKMHLIRRSWDYRGSFVAIYWSHECPEFSWGPNCTKLCTCVKNNTDHCNSTNGQCVCKKGWKSNDCSMDVDECTDDALACPDYSDCQNLHGSYNCTCKDGLVRSNIGCSLDPARAMCALPSNRSSGCSQVCINQTVPGQAGPAEMCYCPIGMVLEAGKCVECKNMTYGPDCSRQCHCVENNTVRCDPQTGACVCLNTWTGPQCSQDIDECYLGIHHCLPMSYCVNTQGGHRCACYEIGHEESENGTCECDHILTNSSGTFTSPNYPQDYFNFAKCSWTITVAEGDVVSLRVLDFKVEVTSKCVWDYIAVYDGKNDSARQIGLYCNSVPALIRSTGNKMFIRFISDGSNVYRGFNASYTSHPCPDFMYGDVSCDKNCTCNRTNTQLCDSANGICICKDGWIGLDCSTDLDECLDSRTGICPANSDCVNTIGSYHCQCHPGFAMNQTSHMCYLAPNCKHKKCSHSCYVNSQGLDECVCPEGLVLDQAEQLFCVVPYYPHGSAAKDDQILPGSNRNVTSSKPVLFGSGVPFGATLRAGVTVHLNGLISLQEGQSAVMGTPDLQLALDIHVDVIATYWANINPSKGQVFHKLYEKCEPALFTESLVRSQYPNKTDVMRRVEKDISTFYNLPGFETDTALVVTWEKLSPYSINNEDVGENTFQAIFVSGWTKENRNGQDVLWDEKTSYVIYLYQQGLMNWKHVPGRPVSIGTAISDVQDLNSAGSSSVSMIDKILGNAGQNGLWTYKVGSSSGPEQKCHKYVCKNANLISDPIYQDELNKLYKCPCTLERLGRQWQLYEKRGVNQDIYCYAISALAKRRLLSGNLRNKLCCYRWKKPECGNWQVWERTWREASYIPKSPDSGHVLLNDLWSVDPFDNFQARENIQAHQWCCRDSKNADLCNRFYKVFPDMGCSNFVVFVPASALGDPHITTLDGKTYTMNGWGEYIMLDIPGQNFTFQARTGRAETESGTLTNATIFTAFAGREGDYAHFQIELAWTNTSMVIIANGADLTNDFYSDEDFIFSNDALSISRECRNTKTVAVVTLPCGVSVKVNVGVKSLEVELEVIKDLGNQTRGLMGNFNGDINDEFILPNGTVLAANLSEREIFYTFAHQWEVTTASSVFIYDPGETAANFSHPGFLPMFIDEANETEVNEARAQCGDNNDACIFDYIVTHDPKFALNTLDTNAQHKQNKENLVNTLPTAFVNNGSLNSGRWVVEHGRESVIHVLMNDSDHDNIRLQLVDGNLTGITVSDNGTVTYTADFDIAITLRLQAVDSRGGSSPTIIIPISTCSGCSGHGACDPGSKAGNGTDEYQILSCICEPAYTGVNCETELDGCAIKPCSVGQNCTDLSAAEQGSSLIGYKCGSCPEGFKDFEGRCADINECNATSPCDQHCVNTEGSYYCECKNGYRLNMTDRQSCIDIDECQERIAKCQQECNNTEGSYNCSCRQNYQLKTNMFECEIDKNVKAQCKHCDQVCIIGNGNVTCDCHQGYEINPKNASACKDIDECSTGNMPCSQVCKNNVGWYHCECYSGYQLESDEISCSACAQPYYGKNCSNICNCLGRGTCDPVRGCVCEDQWTGTNCSVDVNECTRPDACPAGQLCVNEVGSYSCQCPAGYVMDHGVCQDIDECSGPQSVINCNRTEVCVNNRGSFSCQCKTGYTRNSSLSQCIDIDECSRGVDNCEQICENVPGLYNCKCHPGYKLAEDRRACRKDRDLCGLALNCSHGCSVDIVTGAPFCYCPLGYSLINSTICQDINECANNTLNLCTFKSDCVNTNGSYVCSCKEGFKLANDRRTCVACPESTWGPDCASACACGTGADHCNATIGCVCKSGFTGRYCNDDINECESGQLSCQANEKCVNLPGTAVCKCQDGYQHINGHCQDIDECANSTTNNCSQVCTNVDGGFLCSCHPGYMYDALDNTCVDINECDLPISKCERICTNTQGSYRCSCPPGSRLWVDGVACQAITKCQSKSCTGNGSCAVIMGQEICQCPKGRYLDSDGTTCVDSDLCAYNACKHGCEETNGNSSFHCLCNPGEHLAADGVTCTECTRGTWGINCNNNCTCVASNTELCDRVSGNCTCKTGWKGANCSEDSDECTQLNICPEFSDCHNTLGGYTCPCQPGYIKRSAAANDACQVCDPGYYGESCRQRCMCSAHSVCDKVNGSCSCSPGWTGDHCGLDVDECRSGTDPCRPENHEHCHNTEGSYECLCEPGTWKNCFKCDCQVCDHWKFGDNCSQHCGCNTTNTKFCNNTNGRCSCLDGWTGNECSEDVDECENTTICSDHSKCHNEPGTFRCLCDVGYTMKTQGQACQVCDQWQFGDNCSQHCGCNTTNTESCNNTDGRCSCLDGWTGDECSQDVDECKNTTICPDHSKCLNEPGIFRCLCEVGYAMNNTGPACQVCDQWQFGDNCSQPCGCNTTNTESCNNTDGRCSCLDGWTGDECSEDVDECKNTTICCDHSKCLNEPGTFRCLCDVGYARKNAGSECQVCDQWKFGDNCSQPCACNTTNTKLCNNTDGRCSCLDGWTGDECSQDVDECKNTTICSYHSTCHNEPGTFRCLCDVGYTMIYTRHTCQVCDRWKFGDNCSQPCTCNTTNTEFCNNTDGRCSCRDGWMGDECSVDVDECENTTICPEHSGCLNEPGTFTCMCDVGYTMNETRHACEDCDLWKFGNNCSETCKCKEENTKFCNNTDGSCSCRDGWTGDDCSTDEDECQTSAYHCPNHSDCLNVPGTYTCICNVGYKKNDSLCQECDPWTFGQACSNSCLCDSTTAKSCSRKDGVCECLPEWSGPHCNEAVEMAVVETSIRLDYDATAVEFSNTASESYRTIKEDLEKEMTVKLTVQMKVTVIVTVISLRPGSLIADTNVTFPKQAVADPQKDVTRSVLSVMHGGGLEIGGKYVDIFSAVVENQKFSANEDKCKQRERFDPCSGQCQEVENVAICVPAEKDSNTEIRLIIGLSVFLFVLLCVIAGLFAYYCTRKQQKPTEDRNKAELSEGIRNNNFELPHLVKRLSPDYGRVYSPYDQPGSDVDRRPRSVLSRDAGPGASRYSSYIGNTDSKLGSSVYSQIRHPRVGD